MILVSTEIIGNVTLETAAYLDQSSFPLRSALEPEHTVVHMPVHEVPAKFPTQASGLQPYDVVILSDVGAGIFLEGSPHDGIDRLRLLCDWVEAGGGLVMVGGFLSFSGQDGKARWARSSLEPLLPVDMAARLEQHDRQGRCDRRRRDLGRPTARGSARRQRQDRRFHIRLRPALGVRSVPGLGRIPAVLARPGGMARRCAIEPRALDAGRSSAGAAGRPPCTGMT